LYRAQGKDSSPAEAEVKASSAAKEAPQDRNLLRSAGLQSAVPVAAGRAEAAA